MKKYVKKPIPVEASKWYTHGDHQEVIGYNFRKYHKKGNSELCSKCGKSLKFIHGWIDTLEGGHIVCPGDWIIKGVRGEHYPCKHDIFVETYEEVPE